MEEKVANASNLGIRKVILRMQLHHGPIYVYNMDLNPFESIISYEEKDIKFDIFDPDGSKCDEYLEKIRPVYVSNIF